MLRVIARRKVWLWLLIGAAIVGTFLVQNRHRPIKEAKISFWYWHTPYKLEPNEIDTLEKLGVDRMFVRAGTFTSNGRDITLRFPQRYRKGANAFAVHLVFNFDGGVVRHFEEFDLEKMADDVAGRIERQWQAASMEGLFVEGYQLDFDCPTRLLPRYADLVSRIREKTRKTTVSVTGLMSWLGNDGARRLSREIDFMVPQAYEGRTGLSLDKMAPISDPLDLQRTLPKAEDLDCPYYVGLPTYGRVLQYDEMGRITGPYRGLSSGDAVRHRSFRIDRAFPTDRNGKPATPETAVGEQLLFLKATAAAPNGRGLNYTLAYSIPSPSMLGRMLRTALQSRGSKCEGIILYRFPEADDSLNLSLGAIESTLEHKPAKPDIGVLASAEASPYGAIENGAEPGLDVFLKVRNRGSAATFVAQDAVEIEVEFPGGEVDDARPRDMASVSKIGPNKLLFRRANLAVGEIVQIGPIHLLSRSVETCTIRWRVRDPGGFETLSGVHKNVRLRTTP